MADGDQLVVDPNAVNAAKERVESAASALQGSVDDLSAQVQSLASSWDADEQQEYAGVHQKVSNGLETMNRTLTQVQSALEDNSQLVAQMRQNVLKKTTGG